MEINSNAIQSSNRKTSQPWLIGISGASGSIYAIHLIRTLAKNQIPMAIIISEDAKQVLLLESKAFMRELPEAKQAKDVSNETWLDILFIRPHSLFLDSYAAFANHKSIIFNNDSFDSPVASGSNAGPGMLIIPCSMTTLAKIAAGIGNNLITRSAEVQLKEERKLILVPRETPLSLISLRNMLAVKEAGASILPAMPAFYHSPYTLWDIFNFMTGKILGLMGLLSDNDNPLEGWSGFNN